MSEPNLEGLTTARVEAFSDGVFAIAITLLIIEIRIPHIEGAHVDLARSLRALWPSYAAYVLSFVMIGIYWANHHYLFQFFRGTDHVFNLLNVFFLMCIAFVPFPTAVLGNFIADPANQQAAVTLYALGMLLPAAGWFLMWLYAVGHERLIDRRLAPGFLQSLTRLYVLSNALYGSAFIISFWSANAALFIVVGLTLLYLRPPPRPVYRPEA